MRASAALRFSVDFSGLPTVCQYIALMPQWDFLDFLARQGARYPGFRLLMETAATGLIEEGGKVVGLRADGVDGPFEIRADLVVGADGRHSAIRAAAGMAVEDLGAPMDVLWLRLPRLPADSGELALGAGVNRILVMINRGDYWQCAYLIPKGGYDQLKAEGFPAFRRSLAEIVPFERTRVDALSGWDDVKLLSVRVDRLTKWWRPGLLFIGDAAHAMSPIGGVGINLAVQDAVAAANILAGPLARRRGRGCRPRAGTTSPDVPDAGDAAPPAHHPGQCDRPPPFRRRSVSAAVVRRLIQKIPLLQRLAGRAIGLGFRREHIETPDIGARRAGIVAGSGLGPLLLRVAEGLFRRGMVADALLQFGDLGEAPLGLARPDERAVDADLENATGTGDKGDACQLLLEGGEEFLRHPRRPEQPSTLPAILDFDGGKRVGHAAGALRPWANLSRARPRGFRRPCVLDLGTAQRGCVKGFRVSTPNPWKSRTLRVTTTKR